VLGEGTAPLVVAAVAWGIAYDAARHEDQAVGMRNVTGETIVSTGD
jgi:hypothetical protein